MNYGNLALLFFGSFGLALTLAYEFDKIKKRLGSIEAKINSIQRNLGYWKGVQHTIKFNSEKPPEEASTDFFRVDPNEDWRLSTDFDITYEEGIDSPAQKL